MESSLTRSKLLVAYGVLATLAVPSSALAQAGPRQAFEGALTSERPATPSGFTESIDYIPPGGPEGKPYSVQTVRLTLPEGSRFDTGVPARCKASDADLQQRGTVACPPGSRVGGGDVEVDAGQAVGPVPRIIRLRSTLFNDERSVIVFFESTNTTPQIRAVARSPIEGTTVTTQAPPLPGFPPPDPFLAIKSVRIAFDEVTRGDRTYIATPPACPPSGAWTSVAAFTYRDGVTETVSSNSPCLSGAGATAPPHATLRGVPRRGCVSRSFVARATARAPAGLRAARLLLDGRRIARTQRRRFARRIEARALRPGRHRVSLVVTDRDGAVARDAATFSRCPRRQPAFAG